MTTRPSRDLLKALEIRVDLGPSDSPEYMANYMRIRRKAQRLQREKPQTWAQALLDELAGEL